MKNMQKKTILALAMIAVVMTAAIGGTLAYLVDKTEPVVNTFEPSSVPIEIVETFENNVKSDVTVKNSADSDTSVYVRVNLLCYWSDKDGNPAGRNAWKLPELKLGSGWLPGDDGYYYYENLVQPGQSTGELFEGSVTLASEQEGEDTFYQTLDILAQAVQAEPADAVEAAWPVTVSNGKLTLASSGT